jgi:beta-phosphoglucomutase-like phosphatase (HAD superfamily)
MNESLPPKFIIFDCDGVLVDSEVPMHEVLTKYLNECGVNITFETCISTFVGMSIERVIEKAKSLGADVGVNWKSELYAKIFERLKEGVPIIPGVRDLIERLGDNGIPYCVASNGSERKMKLMLGQHGL